MTGKYYHYDKSMQKGPKVEKYFEILSEYLTIRTTGQYDFSVRCSYCF